MCYTTKIKVHATLSFQQFGQKIQKSSLHTGAPHFRHANLVLLRCDGPQIWQRFLAVSDSWTCAGYHWRQMRKCAVDGGPHGGRQHRVGLVGHGALVTARHFTWFSRMKYPAPVIESRDLVPVLKATGLETSNIAKKWYSKISIIQRCFCLLY